MNNYAAVVKPFEELTFCDDFMFGKTMEDLKLCREVIQCLLQREIGELEEIQEQKEFKFTSDGKPIRLDVYSRDDTGTIYDAEMQNKNNKSIDGLQLPKRSRFYQSSIDMEVLNKNGRYKALPDSNVMFICTFDPFGYGLAQYTFNENCKELPELKLNDGTEKHFYNCMYEGDDIPEELASLYRYIRTGETEGTLTWKIEAAVEKGRKNEIWRSSYMKERTIIMDAIEEEYEGRLKAEERAENAEKRTFEAEKEIMRLRELLEAEGIDYSEKVPEIAGTIPATK